jgi:steroid delta-isomerase-like uncharacterized protein
LSEEENKGIVRRWQDAYNSGNLDALDELLAPDWVTNSWPQDLPQTIENAKNMHRALLAFSPDVHFTTEELIAERDRVVQRYVVRGTQLGEFAGLPPTGRRFEIGGISIFRIIGGRIVEHFSFLEELGLLLQLGADMPTEWSVMSHRNPGATSSVANDQPDGEAGGDRTSPGSPG